MYYRSSDISLNIFESFVQKDMLHTADKILMTLFTMRKEFSFSEC